MLIYFVGERRVYIEWDIGILCYLFFKIKVIINILFLMLIMGIGVINY